MLKEEKKFDQFGQKLFMQGTLQEFEKNLPFSPNQEVMVYCRGRLCGYANLVGNELKARGYTHVSV